MAKDAGALRSVVGRQLERAAAECGPMSIDEVDTLLRGVGWSLLAAAADVDRKLDDRPNYGPSGKDSRLEIGT
jgi:hypothetical protein